MNNNHTTNNDYNMVHKPMCKDKMFILALLYIYVFFLIYIPFIYEGII